MSHVRSALDERVAWCDEVLENEFFFEDTNAFLTHGVMLTLGRDLSSKNICTKCIQVIYSTIDKIVEDNYE